MLLSACADVTNSVAVVKIAKANGWIFMVLSRVEVNSTLGVERPEQCDCHHESGVFSGRLPAPQQV